MPKCKKCGEQKPFVMKVSVDLPKYRDANIKGGSNNEDPTYVTGANSSDEMWCKDCLNKGEIRQ